MQIIGVVSDTHGSAAGLRWMAERLDGVDRLIHAGDCVGDGVWLAERLGVPLTAVRGNNDFSHAFPKEAALTVEGVDVYVTHGHRFHVKWGLEMLMAEAYGRQARVCIFGHTHQQMMFLQNGCLFLNPGDAWSCALLRLQDGEASAEFFRR